MTKVEALARLEELATTIFRCPPEQVKDEWFRRWWAFVNSVTCHGQ